MNPTQQGNLPDSSPPGPETPQMPSTSQVAEAASQSVQLAEQTLPEPAGINTSQSTPASAPIAQAGTAASGVDLRSMRAAKARFAQRMTKNGYRVVLVVAIVSFVFAVLAYIAHMPHLPGIALSLSLALYIYAAWWRYDLHPLAVPAHPATTTDRLSRSVLARLKPNKPLTPRATWEQLEPQWHCRFIMNRLTLPASIIRENLSDNPADMATVWAGATAFADHLGSKKIEVIHVAGALLLSSPGIAAVLTSFRLQTNDIGAIVAWVTRSMEVLEEPMPDFGGIGRDWAHGYTPMLDRLGYNVSLGIERQGSHFGWLMQSAGVQAMRGAFSQGAGALALIGDNGIGKTSHVYALAQSLLQENKDRNLEHRQVISLNASTIISNAQRPGELERIMTRLLNEAAHAGHIILFLDDASLFFTNAVGSFNAAQILLPVVQSRAVQFVMALTPRDYQNLKTSNTSFAGLLTPVILQEPGEQDVMRVLEDTTLGFEHRHHVFVTYDALKEAYRLSGRYEQEVAYPGKAINLLEQSLQYGDNKVVTAHSVQRAIEQSRGVKVTQASAAESDTLLNLEDRIHQRMINQTRAVSVVANALRRARAGVANPRRPVGSFLFLGPTGVGKTELAKSISSIYFGDEAKMTRLDMSEYQRPEDVSRLLSDGREDSASLVMSVRQQPFGVVLLDEIEKAHPNILNLMLQLLDEGTLTDMSGRAASFKDCIIIATSNAGANTIRERIGRGETLESFEEDFTNQLISSGQFKPELLNRFDEIVLFRPLDQTELLQVVKLMMNEINRTLAPQNISVELTEAAAGKIVETSYDPRLGARPMRRALQRAVEDTVAQKILRGEARPGDHVVLDQSDLTT